MVRTKGTEGYKSKLLSSKRLQPADCKSSLTKFNRTAPPPPPISFAVCFTRMKTKTKKIKNVLTLKKIKLAWSPSIALNSRGQEKETIYSNAIWRGPRDQV